MKVLTQKSMKITFLVVFCVDDKFGKLIVVFGGENAAYDLLR